MECLDPADVPRFAELGVVACMQPRHCAPEIAGPGRDWAENIGADRWHKAWPWPRWTPWWACTRRSPAALDGGGDGEPWRPEETVDIETAVHGYTMGSAYANFLENDFGSLTVGKLADFVVLSRDILRRDPRDIPGTVAETVVVGGEVVHMARTAA